MNKSNLFRKQLPRRLQLLKRRQRMVNQLLVALDSWPKCIEQCSERSRTLHTSRSRQIKLSGSLEWHSESRSRQKRIQCASTTGPVSAPVNTKFTDRFRGMSL